MSKERELLKECRLMLDNPINGTAGRNLQIRITELLAQPEQEPVAWMQDDIELYVQEEKDIVRGYVIPLYTAPPKQEPLGDGITADMYRANKKATHPDSYWAGVNDAEKAHGITGVDDE